MTFTGSPLTVDSDGCVGLGSPELPVTRSGYGFPPVQTVRSSSKNSLDPSASSLGASVVCGRCPRLAAPQRRQPRRRRRGPRRSPALCGGLRGELGGGPPGCLLPAEFAIYGLSPQPSQSAANAARPSVTARRRRSRSAVAGARALSRSLNLKRCFLARRRRRGWPTRPVSPGLLGPQIMAYCCHPSGTSLHRGRCFPKMNRSAAAAAAADAPLSLPAESP